MNITPHIKYVTEKSKNLFAGFVKLAREHLGLDTKIITTIYTGLVIPILCYAAAGWYERINAHRDRKLKSAQRQALFAITGAYRTTSNDALAVLAAEIPTKCKLIGRKAHCNIKRSTEVKVGEFHFCPTPATQDKRQTNITKQRLREGIIDMWQKEWEETNKGPYRFFPNIRKRIELKDIRNDHNTAQITGHGHFTVHSTG